MKQTVLYRGVRFLIRFVKERIVSLLFSVFYNYSFNELQKLHNIHKGKPAVLIGGGPSINKMNLDKLKDYVTIACNGFYLKMESLDWAPTYYTVEDPLPAKDNSKEISSLKESIKIIPYDIKKHIRKDKKTIYTNFIRSYKLPNSKEFPKFSEDCSKTIFWGGTVMYYNIQLASYFGCNPIYLIGVDLNYKVPQSIIKNGSVLTSMEDDVNHFDPRYFGKGKKWHLPETERMQKAFTKAYFELKKQGIDLINAGLESKLKVVPKKKII